jgi:2-polyprenyl-6-methoxyphenol hydroxylase-like FAD-dependent oxidoreductase
MKASGPLAEFDGADTWVKRPYRAGVALVGDAASSNDPAWGNGLALTLRDVRVLSECLLAGDDWESAGARYAVLHDEHFGAIHRITTWLSELLYEIGPDAEARRKKAFGAMQDGRSRNPDFIALGPDAPSDEAARQRMFGEA